MHENNGYAPIVILVDREETVDGAAAREWIDRSAYNSCEAHDVFQAIEEISDFTMEHRPDVIVLDTQCCADEAEFVRDTFDAMHASEVPVIAISDSGIHMTGGNAHIYLSREIESHVTHSLVG